MSAKRRVKKSVKPVSGDARGQSGAAQARRARPETRTSARPPRRNQPPQPAPVKAAQGGARKKSGLKPAAAHHLPAGRIQKARHPLISLAFLFGGAFALVSGLWIVSSSGVVGNRFKPQLESELSKALSRQVTIERIEGGLFDRVVLRNVCISSRQTYPESLDITIKRVVVQYSLWDILVRKRPLAESLHQIQLIHPLILFERTPEGKWRSPDLVSWPVNNRTAGPAAPGPGIPPIRISLISGEVRLSDGEHETSIKKVKGLLNLKDPSASRLYLSGRTDKWRRQNVKISGVLDLSQGTFRLGVNATRVQLQPLMWVANLSDFFGIPSGQADIRLKIKSRSPMPKDLFPGVGIQGKLVLYDLTVKTKLLNEPLQNVFGVASLEDRNLTLKNMQAILGKTTWSAEGKINNLQAPRLDIRVRSQDLELADLVEPFPNFQQLQTSGAGQAAILIKGKVPDLIVTGNFSMPKGKIGRLKIRKFEIISRYRAGILRLLLARGVFARGWVEGRGRIVFPSQGDQPASLDFSGEAKDLALEDIADLFGVEQVRGRVGGSLTLKGPVNEPVLEASFRAPRMRAAGAEFKNLQGKLLYSAREIELRMNTDWGPLKNARLNFRAREETGGWNLRDLTLYQGRRVLLNARGVWAGQPGGSLQGRITTRNLPIQTLPFLPKALDHLNGILNFSGDVGGTWEEPLLEGKFSTKRLVRRGRTRIDAQGVIRLSRQGVRWQDVNLDNRRIHLSGALAFGKSPVISSDIRFKSVPLAHLLLLGGVEKPEAGRGRIRGGITLSGDGQLLTSKGDVRVQGLDWRGLKALTGILKFSTSGRRVWIKELELVQPGGKFNAVLETELNKSLGPFQVLAWMEDFTIGGRQWTGDFKVKGNYRSDGPEANYSARLSLENFGVDGRTLPSARGKLSLAGRQLTVEELNWGEALSLSGRLFFDPTLRVNAQVRLNQSRLEPIRLLTGPDWESLAEPLSGVLDVEFNRRHVFTNVKMNLGAGELRGEVDFSLAAKNIFSDFNGRLHLNKLSTPAVFNLFHLARKKDSPQGRVSGLVQFEGRRGETTNHSGNLIFNDFVFGQWDLKTLKAVWENQGADLQIKVLEAMQPLGSLRALDGLIRLRPDGLRLIAVNLVADNFAFFTRKYTGHFNLNGILRTAPEFDLRLAVVSPDFQLNRYPFGDFRASLRYWGENLAIRTPEDNPYQIVGDLHLPPGGDVIFHRLTIGDKKQTSVDVRGRVDVRGTSDLLVKVRDVKADVIARSMGWPQPWTGVTNGQVRYTDPNHIPHVEIDVKIDNGSVLRLPFDVFYGHLVIDHDWLHFQGPQQAAVLRRMGKYTMLLSGKLPVPMLEESVEKLKGAEIDLRLSMPQGDFSFITFVPYLASASGPSGFDLTVRGTMGYPVLSGRAWVRDGTLAPRLYSPQIKNLNADLVFEENKVRVERLEGNLGQGKLRVSAGPAHSHAAVFRRLQPHELNLRLESEPGQLRLDTTKDLEYVTAGMELRVLITGTLEAPVIGGTLKLSDGQFTFPARKLTDFTRNLKPANVTYDRLKLTIGNNLWFYNDVVRAQIRPDQTVLFKGGRYQFEAEGRVEVAKGSFTYLDNDFNLDPNEETVVSFPGRQKPRLRSVARIVLRDVEIKDEGRKRDATIFLRVQGEMGALKVTLDSDPELTQAQIMSLLTLGEDFSRWSEAEIDNRIQAAGARVLGRMAGNLIGREIERSIKKFTPLDVIGVRLGGVEKLADSIMSGSSNTSAAVASSNQDITGTSLLEDTQIDVGKYLTDDLFLNYRGILKDRGLDQGGGLSWRSYFGVEYNLDSSKKIKIYKNFDVDSDQELFWGIEGRVQFEGWSPDRQEKKPTTALYPPITPTPVFRQESMN